MEMSGLYPALLSVLVAAIWMAAAVQAQRLLNTFRRKFPNEAQKHIPDAFSRMRHPEKFLFFFRKKSLPLLRSDPAIWRLRRSLLWLSVLSAVVPLLVFATLLAFAVASGFK